MKILSAISLIASVIASLMLVIGSLVAIFVPHVDSNVNVNILILFFYSIVAIFVSGALICLVTIFRALKSQGRASLIFGVVFLILFCLASITSLTRGQALIGSRFDCGLGLFLVFGPVILDTLIRLLVVLVSVLFYRRLGHNNILLDTFSLNALRFNVFANIMLIIVAIEVVYLFGGGGVCFF